jgi:hypothetical protein
MKKSLFFLLSFLFSAMYCNAAMHTYQEIDFLLSQNLVFNGQGLDLNNQPINPYMSIGGFGIIFYSTNAYTSITYSDPNAGSPWWPIHGLTLPYVVIQTNTYINGDLKVSGNITGANTAYSTNSQTPSVDLNLTYGNLQINSPVSLTVKNKSSITYQTAVVLIHNTTGMSTAIVATGMHPTGVLYVTNQTVCTIFYDPAGVPTAYTNITSLPIW